MKASETFHREPWRHNCAQAVGFKWLKDYDEAEYAKHGGGRAPDGCCGALYAAMQACPEHAEDIKREFTAACGAHRCREIKALRRTPCEVCVDTADALLAKYTAPNPA